MAHLWKPANFLRQNMQLRQQPEIQKHKDVIICSLDMYIVNLALKIAYCSKKYQSIFMKSNPKQIDHFIHLLDNIGRSPAGKNFAQQKVKLGHELAKANPN